MSTNHSARRFCRQATKWNCDRNRHGRHIRPVGIVFFWQGFTNREEAQIRSDSDQRQLAAAVQELPAMATMLSTQAEKNCALLFLSAASAV